MLRAMLTAILATAFFGPVFADEFVFRGESAAADSGDVEREKERFNGSLYPTIRLSLNQIVQARDEANWMENVRQVTRVERQGWGRLLFWREADPTWYQKVGQVWASADGKVTFAVARGESRLPQLARDQAELWARVLLAGGGRPGVTVVSLAGTQAVQWEHHGNNVYCLMAVPTALLPQEVER